MRHFTLLLLLLLALPATVLAAIGLLLPSDDIVSQGENATLELRLGIYDPLLRRYLEVAKPKGFDRQHLGDSEDLLASIRPSLEKTAWLAQQTIKRPGDYTFHGEFPSRWDAGDEQFIVHHAKVCVNAFGLEEGWDEPVGLDAEIVPLSRPYGLATGSLFSGQVLFKGEPAPYILVEIVALGPSPDGSATNVAPAAPYLVQKVRADANGVFHAAMPRAGWWGFSASLDADWTIARDGAEHPVAIVTSYWAFARTL